MYVVELQNFTIILNQAANFNLTNIQLRFTLKMRKNSSLQTDRQLSMLCRRYFGQTSVDTNCWWL